MAFLESPVFPERISAYAEIQPEYMNEVAYRDGRRYVLQKDELPVHYWRIDHPVRTNQDFEELRAFWYNVGANRDAFRFRDPTDYIASLQNSRLTFISGNTWQLNRIYVTGTRTLNRTIRKPEVVLAVYRTRSGVATDATADCTTDLTTGVVTIANHVGGDTYAWIGRFHVPVAFRGRQASWRLLGSSRSLMEWPSIELEEDRLA